VGLLESTTALLGTTAFLIQPLHRAVDEVVLATPGLAAMVAAAAVAGSAEPLEARAIRLLRRPHKAPTAQTDKQQVPSAVAVAVVQIPQVLVMLEVQEKLVVSPAVQLTTLVADQAEVVMLLQVALAEAAMVER
jgi:hypothetical protein